MNVLHGVALTPVVPLLTSPADLFILRSSAAAAVLQKTDTVSHETDTEQDQRKTDAMRNILVTAGFFLFLLPALALGRAPQLDTFLKTHSDPLKALTSEEETAAYLSTHLLDAYGNVSALVGFIDSLAGGSYPAASDALVQEKLLRQYLAGASPAQARRLSSLISDIRAGEPLTANINRQMTRLGNILTAYTLASDIVQALSGQDEARIKALATAINTRIGMLANQIGTTSLSVAMGGVAFIDYALKTFITAQAEQYHDFWWQAYTAYLNARYPKLVTGPGSWAALLAVQDGGIQNRLHEFWDAPLENAALYYRRPGPFQRDSLATATFREKFAARYYRDYLETTLTTYTARKAEAARSELMASAETTLNGLGRLMGDIQALKTAVSRYQAGRKAAPVPLEIHLETDNGPAVTGPVCNGDSLAVITAGNAAHEKNAVWIWQVEDAKGIPVKGLYREDKAQGNKAPGIFRFQLNRFHPGTYQIRLSRRTTDGSVQESMGLARFKVVPELIVDKLLATPDRAAQSHHPEITEGRDVFLYAHYRTHRDTDRFSLDLSVSRQGSRQVLAHARAVRPKTGEKPPYRAGIRLPGEKISAGDRLVFRFKAAKTPETGAIAPVTASQTLTIKAEQGQKEKDPVLSPALPTTARPTKKKAPEVTPQPPAQKAQKHPGPKQVSRPEPSVRKVAKPPSQAPARESDSLAEKKQAYNRQVKQFRSDWKRVWREADKVLGEASAAMRRYQDDLKRHFRDGLSRKSGAGRREVLAKISKMPDPHKMMEALAGKLPCETRQKLYCGMEELEDISRLSQGVPGFDHLRNNKVRERLVTADRAVRTLAPLMKYYGSYVEAALEKDPLKPDKAEALKARAQKLAREVSRLTKAFGAAKSPPPVPTFNQLRAAGKFR